MAVVNSVNIECRSLGAIPSEAGTGVTVWAPLHNEVLLVVNGSERINMDVDEFGYWTVNTPSLKNGDDYQFEIEGRLLPDPASVSQAKGVHGPSQVVNLKAFDWGGKNWVNYPLKDYIIYELHTGCFSPEGNFAGVEARLDELVGLGITAIEIMPVAQFPGDRNWGYDGVFPYAVQNSYGGPEGLQKLVDACHAKGLAVILDVVYNHLGPEGNYLGSFAPYFTDKYKTPWGGAINFDDAYCDGVRKYFIENALMWLRDFHIDALRLDAVHAIRDFSPVHILREMRIAVDELQKATGKTHHLIVELDLNDTRFINPLELGGYGMDAQWIDEFHHALRVTAGGERTGYYSDFSGIAHLSKAYTDAYVYDGQYAPHRKRRFGIKADGLAGNKFIAFSQNHDQVGNRMLGERSSQVFSFEMQKLLAGAVMVSPFIPMLFMGEEWSELNPFQYFVSHTDSQLAEAVRKGRKEEFAAFHLEGEAPNPMNIGTFQHSKLQWELRDQDPHKTMLSYYTELIALRKSTPALADTDRSTLQVSFDEGAKTLILHRWSNDNHVFIAMNFSGRDQYIQASSLFPKWTKLFDSGSPRWLGPADAPEEVEGGKPGAIPMLLQPESLVIYSSNA